MDKSIDLSEAFTLSAGTCTVDIKAQKCLVIHWQKTGEYFLPKGRKNVSESLETCATRETLEETGFRSQLLKLDIPTNATIGADASSAEVDGNFEPVAVTQRSVRTTENMAMRKIIFWFAATGDSTAKAVEGSKLEGEEDFEGLWVDFKCIEETLTWEDDTSVARRVIQLVLGHPCSTLSHGT